MCEFSIVWPDESTHFLDYSPHLQYRNIISIIKITFLILIVMIGEYFKDH